MIIVNSPSLIKNSILLLAVFVLLFLCVQTNAVQNPVVKGQIQSIPPNISLKGIKIVGRDNKGDKITTTSDASGQFTLKGLPFNSSVKITAESQGIISDTIEIYTGNKFEPILLTKPLRVLKVGPPGSSNWIIDGKKTVPLYSHSFQYFNNSYICNNTIGEEKTRLTLWHSSDLVSSKIPVVSKEAWIVIHRNTTVVHVGFDYYSFGNIAFAFLKLTERKEYEPRCNNKYQVLPEGWYLGIQDISFNSNSISVKENFVKTTNIEIGDYKVVGLNQLPVGRWAITEEQFIGRSQNFMLASWTDKSGNIIVSETYAYIFDIM